MQATDDTEAWQRWSGVHAELTGLCDRIARTPVSTMAGLAVRFEALAIGLLEEGVIGRGHPSSAPQLRREMR